MCASLKVNLSLQIQFGQKSTWLLFAIFLSVKVVYMRRMTPYAKAPNSVPMIRNQHFATVSEV